MKYFLLLLAACSLCGFWRNIKPVLSGIAPREQLVLDSTVIGVSTVLSGLDVPWDYLGFG
jgi:hypothetical protein